MGCVNGADDLGLSEALGWPSRRRDTAHPPLGRVTRGIRIESRDRSAQSYRRCNVVLPVAAGLSPLLGWLFPLRVVGKVDRRGQKTAGENLGPSSRQIRLLPLQTKSLPVAGFVY